MSRKVLFVCTGNYYRSRFAELLFNHVAPVERSGWEAFSRGLATEWVDKDAGPISPHTVEALIDRQIPLARQFRPPIQITREDLADAHHIVALKRDEHLPLVSRKFPDWIERIEFWQVHDIDFASPEHAIPQIEDAVHELVRRLTSP
jgi:protein-tyrosine phosphatase